MSVSYKIVFLKIQCSKSVLFSNDYYYTKFELYQDLQDEVGYDLSRNSCMKVYICGRYNYIQLKFLNEKNGCTQNMLQNDVDHVVDHLVFSGLSLSAAVIARQCYIQQIPVYHGRKTIKCLDTKYIPITPITPMGSDKGFVNSGSCFFGNLKFDKKDYGFANLFRDIQKMLFKS